MMSINSSLTKQHLSNQMTNQVAIELLKQGNTGEEILSILDVIAEEDNKGEMTDFDGNQTEF
jgi:hypothetical protein